MLHRILSYMYMIPWHDYVVLMASVAALWGVLIYEFQNKKAFRILNAAIAVITAGGALCITVLLRSSTGAYGLIWQPFAVFAHAAQYADVYNQMVLNIVLFFPLGLSLPMVFSRRMRHPLWLTFGCGVLLSVLIEALQWMLARGYTEVDDVMLNGIGTACGLLAYTVAWRLRRGNKTKKGENDEA
ncbi:MAG: VanZ family protein [Clostridia bacterium]|nr:VanZ family protein [Clostridia bacterium]